MEPEGGAYKVPVKMTDVREQRQKKALRTFLTLSVMSLLAAGFIFAGYKQTRSASRP